MKVKTIKLDDLKKILDVDEVDGTIELNNLTTVLIILRKLYISEYILYFIFFLCIFRNSGNKL